MVAEPHGLGEPVARWAPVLADAATDKALTFAARAAVFVCWQYLSPVEYRPLKSEALAHLLGIRRQSAAKILHQLVARGYLSVERPAQATGRRRFLLLNHRATTPIIL